MTALTDAAVVDVFGLRIDRIDVSAALARVDELLRRPGCSRVAFVNAHSVNLSCEDPSYRAALRRSDLVLNDGAGVALLGRATGTPFLANLNGTDFLPLLLGRCTGMPVFLYGGQPGVAEQAAAALERRVPGLQVVGWRDGFRGTGAEAADAVRASGARVVLVALGNPRQELWSDVHGERAGVTLAVSVGAFLDFTAGRVTRAPAAVRRLRLEWAFRLAQEPRRLARRYLLGIPVFLGRVAATWWATGCSELTTPTVETYEYATSTTGLW